jgi:hypothetical protein
MNKQLTPAMMTNGELYEEYKTGDKATQYAMLAEMAKRISRKIFEDMRLIYGTDEHLHERTRNSIRFFIHVKCYCLFEHFSNNVLHMFFLNFVSNSLQIELQIW